MQGIYKLNFALSAGGGINDRGFMNVCRSVQDELGGGIPVNRYIAVTMPVVKDLTNAVGGVDYDMDVAFTIDGRSYKKGMQHLDGQAVLDYCRVRKGELSAQPGDLNRVNRQKKMLVAVFKKLQSTASLATVPRILMSVKGCQTNLNPAQLAALALFGRDLPEKSITMRTMAGTYAYGIFNRNYVLIDQDKRVKLIKDVFGKTVEPQYKYAPGYARLLWAYMQGNAWTKAVSHVLQTDAKLTPDKRKILEPDLTALQSSLAATSAMLDKYRGRINAAKPVVKASEYQELQKQVTALQTLAKGIFAKAKYKVSWSVTVPEQMKMKE